MAYSVAVRPRSGPRTWTVVDGGHRTVVPVEDWLEAHRYLWSPNTVRGYATALGQWWTFLEQRGETGCWREVGVPTVTGFLSWLRNGRTVEHALVAMPRGPSPETLQARLAALISFYRSQEAVFEVPVAARLMRGAPRRAPGRGLLAHLDARAAVGPSALVKVRRQARRGRPPVLLPRDINVILDGCALLDPVSGDWVGNLRDRLLFALLADTGARLGEVLGMRISDFVMGRGGTPMWRPMAGTKPAPARSGSPTRHGGCLAGWVPISAPPRAAQPATAPAAEVSRPVRGMSLPREVRLV